MLQVEPTMLVVPAQVHPTATVEPGAILGVGVRVWHEAQIREHASIGDHTSIGKGAFIDSGVTVGANCKLQNYALLYRGCRLGDGVFVGPGVILTNDARPRAINHDGSLKTNSDWQCGEIVIEDGASLGAGTIILPGIRIGRFALIGAGAVVTHDVPDHALVWGNPARTVGWVCHCAETLLPRIRCARCGDTLEGVRA